MTKPAHVRLDTLDDRRELHRLLGFLAPPQRLAFLEDCCRRATLPRGKQRPVVAPRTRQLAMLALRDSSADERLTLEIYFDLWQLEISYAFDLDAALVRLQALARDPRLAR